MTGERFWRRGVAQRFGRDEAGVIGIEFAFIAPVLALMLLGTATLFNLMRDNGRCEKATFTIADLLSRQPTVNDTGLANMFQLFLKMTPASADSRTMRMTSIKKAAGKFTVDWSYAVAPLVKMTTAGIPTASLPEIADGDSFIIVESHVAYRPLFSIAGLIRGTHDKTAINRPRFTAAIAKTD
jgi:Flp pilus assembly protein TadG